jgi:dihydroorotate dehydrogenase
VNIYSYFLPLLFRFNPELVHRLTLSLMQLVGELNPLNALMSRAYSLPAQPVEALGLRFSNPIGLAAGYDKDGLGWRGLACLGFGHIEVGTVTPKPQPGNPRPRLFRLPEERALINRMGFPGKGAEFVLQQISKPRPKDLVLGVNIGKNKNTRLENAIVDYLYLLKLFNNQADYLAVNVSSPNTVGLRQLQERQELDGLLKQLSIERSNYTHKAPILVKLAPDLSDEQLDNALDIILANHMDGVIAANTTIERAGISSPLAHEQGGLSGRPLLQKSLTMVGKISSRTQGKLPIIGVGGIEDAAGVQSMLDAGATLVQIYTALIYEGPGLVKQIMQIRQPNAKPGE